jgi:hypothetical protein
MTDDIVNRLRIAWESMGDMANAERAEAADEIERLRVERDEARRLLCVKCVERQSSAPRSMRDIQSEAKAYADGRKWDCFREET